MAEYNFDNLSDEELEQQCLELEQEVTEKIAMRKAAKRVLEGRQLDAVVTAHLQGMNEIERAAYAKLAQTVTPDGIESEEEVSDI